MADEEDPVVHEVHFEVFIHIISLKLVHFFFPYYSLLLFSKIVSYLNIKVSSIDMKTFNIFMCKF